LIEESKGPAVAVKLRLMRMGKKKQPTYRVVAADSHSPRDGRFIEILGTYAPRSEPSAVKIDNAKALGWLERGAQPTDTVRRLLEISGAWEEFAGLRPNSKVVRQSAALAARPRPAKATAPAEPTPAAPAAAAVAVEEAPVEETPAEEAPVEAAAEETTDEADA
jgi:small subunit ribosomal protein S16